jgi:hypothetical protein
VRTAQSRLVELDGAATALMAPDPAVMDAARTRLATMLRVFMVGS